jgi:hypothetical protein
MDGYFSFNGSPSGIVYPIPSGTNPFDLLDYDPTQQTLATFFAQLLETNLQPGFSQAAAACKLTTANLVSNSTFGEVIAYELDETLLTTTNYQFPVLYVHDEGSSFDQLSLYYLAIHRHFTISWILPPLSPTQYTVLNPFFHLVQEIWLGYGQQGYDPKVDTNNIWFESGVSFGSIDDCVITKYDGTMKDKQGHEIQAYFPCVEFRLTLVEQNQMPLPQNYPNAFSGATIEIDLVDGYNPSNPIKNITDGYVFPNITISDSSVSSGSSSGGTWFYLYGTGFNNGNLQQASQITVVGAPAADFAIKSSNIVLIITSPAVFGTTGQLGDIVITDLQGNQYSLANSWTYI